MKYAYHLTRGITLISLLALAGCFAVQRPTELPPAPETGADDPFTAVFHAPSYDILVSWDDAPFTKEIPADALQILGELEYPDNDQRYLMHITPTGYHFADYYPSFSALRASLHWQEDADADRAQVAAGCAVTPSEPLEQGFPAYRELCYFNPSPAVSGAYDAATSVATYAHCLIPIETPQGEQGALYFWGIDDDGYDECAFLAHLSQENLAIELRERSQ